MAASHSFSVQYHAEKEYYQGLPTSDHKNDENVLHLSQQLNPSSPSCGNCWGFKDFDGNSGSNYSKELINIPSLKKSHSLGNILEDGRYNGNDTLEIENTGGVFLSENGENCENSNLGRMTDNCVSNEDNCAIHHPSLFSIEDREQFAEGSHFAEQHSTGHNSGQEHPGSAPSMIEKSPSVNSLFIRSNALDISDLSGFMRVRSRSCPTFHLEEFNAANSLRRDELCPLPASFDMLLARTSFYESRHSSSLDGNASQEHVNSKLFCGSCRIEYEKLEDKHSDHKPWHYNLPFQGVTPILWDSGHEFHQHTKSYATVVIDLNGDGKQCDEQHLSNTQPSKMCYHDPDICGNQEVEKVSVEQEFGELTPRSYHFKRIQDWINHTDFQNDKVAGESGESSIVASQVCQRKATVGSHMKNKKDPTGMELAYNHISKLKGSLPSAQLANIGLVEIPVLSAFTVLRELNLSSNSIVKITSGALPKGLHILNLSKNCITAIEGLRDLTRLRMLDLSYNRISRIGHGLASCASLKELYLACNKISEVDGLHRLLKLKVLDLRFNKISTAKGLSQLAANYNSLEIIYLEGNPAQKNVGDEHLRKYLISLLPSLVYYNKQPVRAYIMKGAPDPLSHIGSSHHGDRSTRSSMQRSTAVPASRKSSSRHATSHGSSALKKSGSRNVLLQPLETKTPATLSSNIIEKQPEVLTPMRRIRSDGKL